MKVHHFAAVALVGAAAWLTVGCIGKGETVVNTQAAQTGISATGTGRASGAPDIVTLDLGVQAEAKTVAEAREQAARSLQAVVDSVKKNGVDDKDIRTVQFSVAPQYDYSRTVPVLKSYQVTNVLNVKVRKVDNAAKVIDDAVNAGGNNAVIRGISFSIDDPTKLRDKAREDALKEARQKAEQMAKLTGVDLGKPLSISESTSGPVIQYSPAVIAAPRTGAGDTSTPIQAGDLEILVSVSVTYRIE